MKKNGVIILKIKLVIYIPAEFMDQVAALIKQGYEKSSAYAIAVSSYKKKHGHPPDLKQHSEGSMSESEINIIVKDDCFSEGFRKRVEDKILTSLDPIKINLSWENDFVDFDSPLVSFKPMKPEKIIYNLNDNSFFDSENKRYVIEKKQNGFRATIHKKGNLVKIYSGDETDITSSFQTIVEEAKKIDVKDLDYVIDGEFVCYENRNVLGVTPIINLTNNPKYQDDSNMFFFASDMVYNGKDISSLSLEERKRNLKMLDFSNHIKYVPFVIVSNKEDFERGTNLFTKMSCSEGCLIKDCNSVYLKDSASKDWVFLSNTNLLNVIVSGIDTKQSGSFECELSLLSENDSIRNKKTLNGSKIVVIGTATNLMEDLGVGDFATVLVKDAKRINYSDNSFDYFVDFDNIVKKNKEQITTNLSFLEDIVYLKGTCVSG